VRINNNNGNVHFIMCPPLSRPRPNFFSLSNILYHTWIDSTRCVSALFFEHKNDRSITCPKSYSAKPRPDKTYYSGVLRHYIHFGNIPRYEKCAVCNVILASSRDLGLRYLSKLSSRFSTILVHARIKPVDGEATIVGITFTRL